MGERATAVYGVQECYNSVPFVKVLSNGERLQGRCLKVAGPTSQVLGNSGIGVPSTTLPPLGLRSFKVKDLRLDL